MKIKQCCYMARDCTPACVSYFRENNLSDGFRDLGMNEMHCMRLFLDLAGLIGMRPPSDEDEFDDEDYDEEDEES